MSIVFPDVFLEQLAGAIAERVAPRVVELVANSDTPWMDKAEAIAYTRMKPGTFEKKVAAGEIPTHGGQRTQLFHRAELDRALGYIEPAARDGHVLPLRRAQDAA